MRDREAATQAGDMKAIEEGAHSLKSSCGNLGAKGLVELFKEIERLGREQEPENISDLVNRSSKEFDRVQMALTEAK